MANYEIFSLRIIVSEESALKERHERWAHEAEQTAEDYRILGLPALQKKYEDKAFRLRLPYAYIDLEAPLSNHECRILQFRMVPMPEYQFLELIERRPEILRLMPEDVLKEWVRLKRHLQCVGDEGLSEYMFHFFANLAKTEFVLFVSRYGNMYLAAHWTVNQQNMRTLDTIVEETEREVLERICLIGLKKQIAVLSSFGCAIFFILYLLSKGVAVPIFTTFSAVVVVSCLIVFMFTFTALTKKSGREELDLILQAIVGYRIRQSERKTESVPVS